MNQKRHIKSGTARTTAAQVARAWENDLLAADRVDQLPEISHSANGQSVLRWLDLYRVLTATERKRMIAALCSPFDSDEARIGSEMQACIDDNDREDA